MMLPDPVSHASAPQATTAHTVARSAGVSQSTVSLVLSGKWQGRVAPGTAERVLQVAAQLHYHPNVSGRRLRTGRSELIGLAVPDGAHPFFGELFVAADQAARLAGYTLMLLDTVTDPRWAGRVADLLRSNQLAGCIVYSGDAAAHTTLGGEQSRLILIEPNTAQGGHFTFDFAYAMDRVVAHLTELGHRRVGYFAADYASVTFQQRYEAFQAAARRHRLVVPDSARGRSTFEVESATQAALQLLRSSDITALVCDDDLLAAAVIRACRQLGRRVPQDLSVIGFGDLAVARYVEPELTTVRLPAAAMGRAAVETLLHQLERGGAAAQRLFSLEVVVRASTGVV